MVQRHSCMVRGLLVLILTLESILIKTSSGSAFVTFTLVRRGRATCSRVRHNVQESSTSMLARAGQGGHDVTTSAVVIGLLGLQLLAVPAVAVPSTEVQRPLPRVEMAKATSGIAQRGRSATPSASSLSTEEELIEEVEKLELKTEVEGDLAKQSKRKPEALPEVFQKPKKGGQSRRVELMEIPQAKLTSSVGAIQKLAPYLDEVEYLITARNWDYLKGFLGVFASCEGDFVTLIDGMYPTSIPSDISARDSMQYEAQNVFLAVDDLNQAAMSKKVKGAEKAYVKLALAYDRFMKAGNIVARYDPISSTEKFFKDIPDEMLRYDRDSKVPLEVRDEVLILKGPDKGRTGRLVGIIKSRNEGIVRVDGKVREMRILEISDIARQLPDDQGPANVKRAKK